MDWVTETQIRVMLGVFMWTFIVVLGLCVLRCHLREPHRRRATREEKLEYYRRMNRIREEQERKRKR
jgi:hypothetical protein